MTFRETKKYFVSWEEVEHFVDKVCEKYKDLHLSGIYGLPRGGLVLATMISYRLNIPLLMAPIDRCMVIDDISDTGETLLHYRNKNYEIVTMYYSSFSKVVPNYYFIEKNDENLWIVYPWESKEQW